MEQPLDFVMRPLPFPQPSPRTTGFSLVEVALSLGILSFSLVTLMALVPVALRGSRDAIDKSLELELVQATRARLLSYPYATLPASGVFYFTPEAVETSATGEVRYEVAYTNEASTNLPGGQSTARVRTSRLTIRNVETRQSGTTSLHLPDNGQ